MLIPRPSAERGHADHGWLDARHSFSFAQYHDPRWMGFGPLRVLNQDRVQPGTGFGLHGHRDMEIVTWVLDGALRHEDTLGSGSVLRPGDVQVMSAGSGIRHSEFNASRDEVLHLLQMWVEPRTPGGAPTYAEQHLEPEELAGKLALLASPDADDGSLTIGQDARVYASRPAAGDSLTIQLDAGRSGWLHLARGALEAVADDGQRVELGDGDGLGLHDVRELTVHASTPGEFVFWDLP